MTIAHFPPALLGLLLMFTGLAMAGARAGYCVTELSANTDPCLMTGKAGLYFMSREKGYSLNCGSYDCEKMIQIYLKTKRIPEPIER
jgi:hypothetical protein